MILAANGGALGGHMGSWRHRDAFGRAAMRLDAMVATARLAEEGGLDMIFPAGGNGVRQMDEPAWSAALSQHTERIGLVATTPFEEPT